MQKSIYLIFFLAILPLMAQAQTMEDARVAEVIQRLFRGMYQADSTMVQSVFDQEVTMVTVLRTKEGTPFLRKESVNEFVKSVSKPITTPLTEEIWNLKIQMDGDLAQAWCDYAFYIGHTFSHCGVDAFHLLKTKEGWKIFHLADTRRKEDCNIPEQIQKKHN